MTPSDFSHADLEQVVVLVEQAGLLLARRFRKQAGALQVDYKGPRDLVTTADRESEEFLLAGLEKRFPGTSFLSEETGHVSGSIANNAGLWIIDPLDGTTNYAHGHPFFAVSVGFYDGREPVAGVIHAPMLGETFWALRGGGAFRRSAGVSVELGTAGRVEPMSVNTEARLDQAMLATGFSYSRLEVDDGALETFAKLLKQAREIRRAGSACLDLAYTAAGTFGGFWEYHLKPHDVAAGALLVTEAGGAVSDVRGGAGFLYGGSIVATNAVLHETLLEILAAGPDHPDAQEPPRPEASDASTRLENRLEQAPIQNPERPSTE